MSQAPPLKTPNPNALEQARAVLADLHARADSGAPALRDGLARLDALLAAAEAETEALRNEAADHASLIAHEVRLPLTSVRGYADMLRQGIAGELTDTQRQFAAVIRDNAVRMEELINNINDLSKLRAGRLKIDPKVALYRDVINAVENQVRPLADDKGHALTFATPDDLPALSADSARLSNALAKLVANALLYTPEGAGEVTVAAASVDGALRVTVADNGIGMSAEELSRLGEPFWRADHDLVRGQKGHGLGFAVAKGIIELHGGAVEAASAPDAGTTVTVTLPESE
ncbi:MAG: HAMP domain-containing histidine kinase [Anaerolineae bacterium]|nr:HAMP domain-containing histidine kinase [Anaerolineae bacterium]